MNFIKPFHAKNAKYAKENSELVWICCFSLLIVSQTLLTI